MSYLRLRKSQQEIKFLMEINVLVEKALRLVMQKTHPEMYDYQAEAIFKAVCLYEGQCHQCACVTPATSFRKPHKFRDGDMVVLNLRVKLKGYKITFTQSFPANGKFTKLQTDIYTAVLEAHNDLIKQAKNGVEWTDLLIVSSRLLLFYLRKCGLLVGNLEDMMRVQLASVFQSREVVSLMEKDLTLPAMLRMNLCKMLVPGMVLSVESSCYFTAKRLAAAISDPRKARFLMLSLVKQLNESYSVCLKNTILISKEGNVVFIPPKGIQQIEKEFSHQGTYF